MDLSKQIAIVSGATGALGSVVAGHLASLGARVAAPATSDESARKLSHSWSSELFVAVADLREHRSASSFVRQVRERFGEVSILVNTAGGYAGGYEIGEEDAGDLAKMLELNLHTAFNLCRAVIPGMKKAGYGRIVNISAMPAVLPSAGSGAYAISKRGVIALTEAIAAEQKGTGITANAIAPSIIRTASNLKSMPKADHSRWVPPEEIARLVATLCSPDFPSLSGNTLRMFGGVS